MMLIAGLRTRLCWRREDMVGTKSLGVYNEWFFFWYIGGGKAAKGWVEERADHPWWRK